MSQHKLFPNQNKVPQSRPIILNRRSLSSSSIPRKKKEHELPHTSRDESYTLQQYNDTPGPSFNSQTVPLPSHSLLFEDSKKLVDGGYLPYRNMICSNTKTQQSYNNILQCDNQESSIFQLGDPIRAANPYVYVNPGGQVEPASSQTLVMLNPRICSSQVQNAACAINPSVRFPSDVSCFEKENSRQQFSLISVQTPKLTLENSSNGTKLFDVNQTFHQSGILMSDGNSNNTTMNDSLSAISWMGQLGANNIFSSIDTTRSLEAGRPPYSYMALIQFAINSSPTHKMTLRQIYNWIEETFPYFKHAKPGWKNSIRHNLSLHDIFMREISPSSKSSYWTLRPDLNQRPLTLACVAARMGKIHPLPLSSVDISKDGTAGSQQFSQINRPYFLMPMSANSSTPFIENKIHMTDALPSVSTSAPFIKKELSKTSTPRMQASSSKSGYNPEIMDVSTSLKENKGQNLRKRKRKQLHEILNDSFNDSLYFTESLSSPIVSPLLPDDLKEDNLIQGSMPSFVRVKEETGGSFMSDPESGYFEQTRSSVASTDLLLGSSKRHCDITNDNFSRTTFEGNDDDAGNIHYRTGDESAMVDGLPQLFGVEGFSFNSSFAKLLNSSNVSLFNLSDRSVQFSDFEDL